MLIILIDIPTTIKGPLMCHHIITTFKTLIVRCWTILWNFTLTYPCVHHQVMAFFATMENIVTHEHTSHSSNLKIHILKYVSWPHSITCLKHIYMYVSGVWPSVDLRLYTKIIHV